MELEALSFEETCPTVQFSFWQIAGKQKYRFILIAKFLGRYRFGSGGNRDAFYMHGVLATAINLWNPESVIIDFSEFEYEWGDMIEYVFNAVSNEISAVVIGPKCREALSTLIFGTRIARDITEDESYYDTLEGALARVRQLVA